jgi:hypothetical protein
MKVRDTYVDLKVGDCWKMVTMMVYTYVIARFFNDTRTHIELKVGDC